MFLPNLKSVASPVLEIVTIGALGCEPPILEIGGRRGSEFEMALVSSYRPSIVIPLSLRVSEILPLLCSRKSPTLFRTEPSPTPYRLLFPKIGSSQSPPKTPITIISEWVKLRTSNLAGTFTGSFQTKDH